MINHLRRVIDVTHNPRIYGLSAWFSAYMTPKVDCFLIYDPFGRVAEAFRQTAYIRRLYGQLCCPLWLFRGLRPLNFNLQQNIIFALISPCAYYPCKLSSTFCFHHTFILTFSHKTLCVAHSGFFSLFADYLSNKLTSPNFALFCPDLSVTAFLRDSKFIYADTPSINIATGFADFP